MHGSALPTVVDTGTIKHAVKKEIVQLKLFGTLKRNTKKVLQKVQKQAKNRFGVLLKGRKKAGVGLVI